MKSVSYHTHHSAFGAYSSFIMGRAGVGGGFVLCDVVPPNNNIYIGYKREDSPIHMMPFFKEKKKAISQDFGLDKDDEKNQDNKVIVFDINQIERKLEWSSDQWKAGDISFEIITPFDYVKDPAESIDDDKKKAYLTAIFARINFDNTKSSKRARIIVGIEGIHRRLSEATDGVLQGGALDTRIGFACKSQDDVYEHSGLNIVNSIFSKEPKKDGKSQAVAVYADVDAFEKKN